MNKPHRKIRLDELLVRHGLCESRSQAKALIMAGRVRKGTEVLDKPGRPYPADLDLTLVPSPRYVSRGGEKMAAFLEEISLSIEGANALDVGASTGGFSDCLLQQGAATVTCVDVGRGQLHSRLRIDPRVTNLEQLNARYLTPESLSRPVFDLIVVDLSFISLRKVLSVLWPLLAEGGQMVALVKPQFEATKKEADRSRGVIRNPDIHRRVVEEIRNFVQERLKASREFACIESSLKGADGNTEFFLGWQKEVHQLIINRVL